MSKVMSTKIDDLPDSSPSPSPNALGTVLQQNISDLEEEMDYNYVNPNQSNIKANIKKKVHFADEKESIWMKLRNEINEENALLLFIIVIATTPSFAEYATKIPYLGNYYNSSNIFKAAFLLVTFLLLKIFLLPKLSI
jgi:hypothetical protein